MLKIITALLALSAPAYAAEAILPITVTIIQCGTQEEAAELCRTTEPRCCNIVKPGKRIVRPSGQWEDIEHWSMSKKDGAFHK
jgi:hypothetical protein